MTFAQRELKTRDDKLPAKHSNSIGNVVFHETNSEFGRPALAALSATFSQLEARKLALSAASAGLPNSL